MARFVYRCHMRWGDMDAYAHVNNTAYVTYLEQARVAMFFDRYDGNFARGTVIARHEISYLRPVVYHPEPLRLELWVDEIRAASFQVRYEVFDGSALVARAATRCVPFDFATDRPRRITAAERDLLATFADQSNDVDDTVSASQLSAGESSGRVGHAGVTDGTVGSGAVATGPVGSRP